MEFGPKKIFFREIDLFDFTSFFGLAFSNFLAYIYVVSMYVTGIDACVVSIS